MSKYQRLSDLLASQRGEQVTISFSQMEGEGIALPHSARTYREWWANQDRPNQARSWMRIGWRVDSVDLTRGCVRFVRQGRSPDTTGFKYEPLKKCLSECREDEAPFTFDEIEQLGISLPSSARSYAPWWANDNSGGHVQAKAWLEPGWRTSKVDVARQRVVFVKDESKRPQTRNRTEINLNDLSPAGEKLIAEYTAEAGGDASAAILRAIHEAAMARRKRVVDQIVKTAVKMPESAQSAVEMIREDRDRDAR